LPPDCEIPANVTAAFEEGQRCLGVNAPHAAAAMFRTAPSYIVEDKGSAQPKGERDLADKIRVMAAQPEFALVSDWMTQVRLYVNARAHPDIFRGEHRRGMSGARSRSRGSSPTS